MKTVILCGGFGTRLGEETEIKPKPMVEIGNYPILWHIMKIYAHYGYKDFILPLGYKGEIIKQYFANYFFMANDVNVDIGRGQLEMINKKAEDFNVTMIDTGLNTLTGGRLKFLETILKPQGTFMLTYGDGVADINISKLVEFHKSHGKLVTVTAVRPTARFGGLTINNKSTVVAFEEKRQTRVGWINGGFFVMEPGVFDYLQDEDVMLETSVYENIAKDGQMMAYQHKGFWHCMDTMRDKNSLNQIWNEGNAPWKTW